MPDLKDAMVAIIGAAVALAGLLLIFSGFLFAQAVTFDPESTSDRTIENYKAAARAALVPFAASLFIASLSLVYWFAPVRCLGVTVIALFWIIAFGTIAFGFWAIRKL